MESDPAAAGGRDPVETPDVGASEGAGEDGAAAMSPWRMPAAPPVAAAEVCRAEDPVMGAESWPALTAARPKADYDAAVPRPARSPVPPPAAASPGGTAGPVPTNGPPPPPLPFQVKFSVLVPEVMEWIVIIC